MKAIQRERYYPMVAVLSAAIASALFAAPSGAQDSTKTATAAATDAEKKTDTPTDETKSLDSVTVVGFRASLEKALERAKA